MPDNTPTIRVAGALAYWRDGRWHSLDRPMEDLLNSIERDGYDPDPIQSSIDRVTEMMPDMVQVVTPPQVEPGIEGVY